MIVGMSKWMGLIISVVIWKTRIFTRILSHFSALSVDTCNKYSDSHRYMMQQTMRLASFSAKNSTADSYFPSLKYHKFTQ